MSDRLFGVVALAVCVAMAAAAWQLEPPISYEPLGPSAFPLLLAALMAALGLNFVLRPAAGAHWPQGALRLKVAAMVVMLLGYALLFQPLGFVAATALLTIGLGRLFGAGWRGSVVAGPLLGLGLFLLFDRLLDVALPMGALWPAAGL
jgi:putative tricarboxylic transport membrane protein